MSDINRTENRQWPTDGRNERLSGGIVLLSIGGLLLARQLGAPLPDWLFTWPMILIAVGLYTGIKLRFRNPGWLIPTFVGVVFLIDKMFPAINLRPFVVPIVLIGVGILFMFRPRRFLHFRGPGRWNPELVAQAQSTGQIPDAIADRSDFIDATSIFGAVKKIVLSKNFQGGDITNFMGGSEINLTQADFNGRIRIDTTNVFGGTKLIVPAHWDVQSQVVAVFGGVDDKRRTNGVALDSTKVVVLDGTCFFGGIEISSF